MSGRLWPYILLIVAVILGRTLMRRLYAVGRLRTPWGEPEPDTKRESAGWILLLAGFVGAALLLYACPFPRIE